MTKKNYTYKIVMFDVNSAKRVAKFETLTDAQEFIGAASWDMYTQLYEDSTGKLFNVANIVQINPIEVIE